MSIKSPENGWNMQRVPTHPGEMLREEFLKPLDLPASRLAAALHIPVTRITEILHERRGVTADTALRLGRYFGMSPQFWINLQSNYDLELTKRLKGKAINRDVKERAAS